MYTRDVKNVGSSGGNWETDGEPRAQSPENENGKQEQQHQQQQRQKRKCPEWMSPFWGEVYVCASAGCARVCLSVLPVCVFEGRRWRWSWWSWWWCWLRRWANDMSRDVRLIYLLFPQIEALSITKCKQGEKNPAQAHKLTHSDSDADSVNLWGSIIWAAWGTYFGVWFYQLYSLSGRACL